MSVTRVMIAGAMLSGLLLGSTAASAHHSFAMFDRTKNVTVEGTVKSVDYANPHVWVYMVVPDAQGKPVDWGMEGGNLGGLYRMGWAKDTVKPGDKIKMAVHPLRDGKPGGQIVAATLANGKVLGRGPGQAE